MLQTVWEFCQHVVEEVQHLQLCQLYKRLGQLRQLKGPKNCEHGTQRYKCSSAPPAVSAIQMTPVASGATELSVLVTIIVLCGSALNMRPAASALSAHQADSSSASTTELQALLVCVQQPQPI